MASINATTSSGIVATADNTGQLALQAAGTTIATISSTGLTMNSGNIIQASGAAPTFSAYAASATSLANSAATKVLFDTEEWDTNNNFASSRFTPTVAGYYQLSTNVGLAAYQTTETILAIFKNGGIYRFYSDAIWTRLYYFGMSDVVYANGTTDYYEVYVYQFSGSAVNTATGSSVTRFSGCFLRSA